MQESAESRPSFGSKEYFTSPAAVGVAVVKAGLIKVWAKSRAESSVRRDLMDLWEIYVFFPLGEWTHILVLWLHSGLCLTVPCLDWSQGSCRLQAGSLKSCQRWWKSLEEGESSVLTSILFSFSIIFTVCYISGRMFHSLYLAFYSLFYIL